MFYVLDSDGVLEWEVSAEYAIPADMKYTTTSPPKGMVRPRFYDGVWEDLGEELHTPSHEELCAIERLWRNSELGRADVEINKLTDAGLDAQEWKAYRVSLRNWPQSQLFPDSTKRPAPPVA